MQESKDANMLYPPSKGPFTIKANYHTNSAGAPWLVVEAQAELRNGTVEDIINFLLSAETGNMNTDELRVHRMLSHYMDSHRKRLAGESVVFDLMVELKKSELDWEPCKQDERYAPASDLGVKVGQYILPKDPKYDKDAKTDDVLSLFFRYC
jgi:hypothetical protein